MGDGRNSMADLLFQDEGDSHSRSPRLRGGQPGSSSGGLPVVSGNASTDSVRGHLEALRAMQQNMNNNNDPNMTMMLMMTEMMSMMMSNQQGNAQPQPA